MLRFTRFFVMFHGSKIAAEGLLYPNTAIKELNNFHKIPALVTYI